MADGNENYNNDELDWGDELLDDGGEELSESERDEWKWGDYWEDHYSRQKELMRKKEEAEEEKLKQNKRIHDIDNDYTPPWGSKEPKNSWKSWRMR